MATKPDLGRFATREEWLNAFMMAAEPTFEAVGAPIPPNTRIGLGFTSSGRRGKAIGECWSYAASGDGHFEIFIRPSHQHYDGCTLEQSIAAVLTHELVHAAVGLDAKHGPIFKGVASALGLEGKMTATYPGDTWHVWATPILDHLGPIPHANMRDGATVKPKQKTYLLKVQCDECGWTARTTAAHVRGHAHLNCPVSGCDGRLVED